MAKIKNLSREIIIDRLSSFYGDQFDFSLSEYNGMDKPMSFICKDHGLKTALPLNMIKHNPCDECVKEKRLKRNELNFINKLFHLYNTDFSDNITFEEFADKYNFEIPNSGLNFREFRYAGNRIASTVICKEHGAFSITPSNLIAGHGCKKCGIIKNSKNRTRPFSEFLKEAEKVHGNLYSYDESTFVNRGVKMRIIDPLYGEFFQTPQKHLNGQGCPLRKSSKMENFVLNVLKTNSIKFIPQYRLEENSSYPYDFYLPEHGILIECQGEQHFYPVSFYGKIGSDAAEINYESQIKRDKEKFENAKKGKRRLIYYIDKKLFSKNRNIHNPFYDDKECYFTKSKMEEFLTKLNK
jgi:hypothetical protein